LGLDFAHHAIERLITLIGTILDLELKTGDGAKPVDRRWWKDCDHRIADASKFGLQFLRKRKARQVARGALLKWFERDEDDASRRAVDETVDRKPWKGDRALHARLFHCNVRHFADDLLGAVKRRALGQLREAHEILLVLQRHEPRRHDAEDDKGRGQQECVNSDSAEFVRENVADAAAVIFRSSLEHAIKA